jgi:ABC-type sugar transport system ATPase subunit
MRMTDETVRLVIVDEPSAAMDPEGEFELFKHLREAREGRTMVFITHRFGHLTKHADLIL